MKLIVTKPYIILFLFVSGILFTCSEPNNQTDEIAITVSDFSTTIDEIPEFNQSLGFVSATTNQGTLTFSIMEQSVNNALSINEDSGELTVANAGVFNFDTNPEITAIIRATNETVFEDLTATITLNNINNTVISVSDFEVTLFNIPTFNQTIGFIDAATNQGTLTYSIIQQFPNEILEIDPSTGELFVNYELDFTGNAMITGQVAVSNESESETVNITVNLSHPCDESVMPILTAYYPMNGNANDESDFSNNGIVEGPVLANDRFSNANSAYYFDGVDDEIRILDSEQLYLGNEFTLSAWVYPEEVRTQQIVRKGTAVNGESSWPYGLSLSGTNDIVFSITAGGVLYQARKTGYNTNEWYLITGVLINQTMYLYVNDELVATERIEGSIFDDAAPLLIGTRLNLPSSTFKGTIDEVRIYDSAICPEDIIELYNN